MLPNARMPTNLPSGVKWTRNSDIRSALRDVDPETFPHFTRFLEPAAAAPTEVKASDVPIPSPAKEPKVSSPVASCSNVTTVSTVAVVDVVKLERYVQATEKPEKVR